MKKQKTKRMTNSKGFSFIEAMLAVAVMVTGIIAAMQLFTAGIRQSMESRDQTIGAMLAQEGSEIVQNIRDNNWAARNTREAFDNLPSIDADNCRVSYLSTSMTDSIPSPPGMVDYGCGSGLSDKILYLSASNYYGLNSNDTLTKFQRKIIIKYDASGSSLASKAEVTSVVIWEGVSLEGITIGHSFPSEENIDSISCGTVNNCAYSKTLLSKWAE